MKKSDFNSFFIEQKCDFKNKRLTLSLCALHETVNFSAVGKINLLIFNNNYLMKFVFLHEIILLHLFTYTSFPIFVYPLLPSSNAKSIFRVNVHYEDSRQQQQQLQQQSQQNRLIEQQQQQSRRISVAAVIAAYDNLVARDYECSKCARTFPSKRFLARHLAPNRKRCPVCCKRFRHISNVVNHERVHTGEKPFACPVCRKSFAQEGNLRTHVRIHSGHTPYVCPVCRKSFAQMANLRSHSRTHATSTPSVASVFEDMKLSHTDSTRSQNRCLANRCRTTTTA